MLFGHDEGKNLKQLCNGLKDVICIAMGGTGADNPADARKNLGLGAAAEEDIVPIAKGGTGAKTATAVKDNLGIAKSLWSGSWASGSIEVPNTADYNLFQITLDGQGTSILAMKTGSYIRGIGGHPVSAGLSTQGFAASFSGNTWTFSRTNQMSHSSGADHGSQTSGVAVERIRGII